ncbi:MAG TPA: MASE1 domain-containing protein [Thermoanaerobaculia bacterium]|nr:MASE1 domain-containing protein [Thermoanaerobaculia bacterium]
MIVLGVALLYIACAKFGLALAFQAAQVTAVWPPTGFALVAVLRYRRAGALGVLLGAFIANATAQEPLWVAAGIAAGNTLEALIGATFLRRVEFDGHLARVRDVIALLGALAISPVVSATIGVASLGAGRVQPASSLSGLWLLWWLGDALGGLIFAPAFLVWSDREVMPRRRGALMEGTLLLLGVIGASIAVFTSTPLLATEYVVFPFLIWAALRFGPAGTATAAVAANVIAVWGTQAGHGPFAGAGPEQGLVLLQIFMAIASTTGLFLGAISAQNRRAQERAEISEQRLLLAMSAARISVFDWNIRTGELDAYRKLIHPDDLPRVDEAISKAIATRAPYEAEFRLLGPDGIRWIDARGKVVEDDQRRAARMVGVAIDVTRQKELEEELRLQHRRKDEFLAMLGHELRNPLAPIVHAVDLLASKEPGDVKQAAQIIRRQSRLLSRLVDDLLDMSRIARSAIRLERRRVALQEMVTSAVETWRHLINQRRQQLSIDLPQRPIWLDVDPMRFTQVIANLVHNAAKFTPDEGRIAISAAEEDGAMVLRVRDNGQGMSEDVLEHAFELFMQGPPPLDRPHGGLGLGLTLAQRLVELHDGTIEAKSEGLGRGSEFVVRMPIASPPVDFDARVAPPIPAAKTSRRILIVEDNPDARQILSLLLKREGHEVRTAADGHAALAEAQRFVPEVVLLDIGLPGMDGYAVARQLRASRESAGAYLVALTGYGQPEDLERSRAAGFDQHLLKPVTPENLMQVLKQERIGA